MDRIHYSLQEPWPEVKTLNQLYDNLEFRSAFKDREVSMHVGSRALIPTKWRKSKPNFFPEGVEFVLLNRIDRGIERKSAPYRFLKQEGHFLIVENSHGTRFAHPTFLQRNTEGKIQYRSTAAAIWASRQGKNIDDGIEDNSSDCEDNNSETETEPTEADASECDHRTNRL
ncbi:hypothetical protein R1sor_017210 [Riccia sorocarpa]|uniref:Uncharacterized protein n=1 Tax=Riccia sorocarpa TaxID=122646 RepID=A0ABD3I6J6_9MARC